MIRGIKKPFVAENKFVKRLFIFFMSGIIQLDGKLWIANILIKNKLRQTKETKRKQSKKFIEISL